MSKKTVFIAFAIEDEKYRNYLKGQSLLTNSPFEYTDMSVKEAYVSAWKEKVRARIRRSDGVIALISSNSLKSEGQKWEIQCAREEGKRVMGLRISKDDATTISGIRIISWTWDNVASFINFL